MAKFLLSSDHQVQLLDRGWMMIKSEPGLRPEDLLSLDQNMWFPVTLPNTVAGCLRDLKRLALQNLPSDDFDYWFKTTLTIPKDSSYSLFFEGLATDTSIFLDGVLSAQSHSMFTPKWLTLSAETHGTRELLIQFKSLKNVLTTKKPRPRWRTLLVSQTNLRHIRTSLLGRMPAWCPPFIPIGPFRPVYLIAHKHFSIVSSQMHYRLSPDESNVQVSLALRLKLFERKTIKKATFYLGPYEVGLNVENEPDAQDEIRLFGNLSCQDIQLWWPHTHGQPKLYEARAELEWDTQDHALSSLILGKVGFRSIQLIQNEHETKFLINNQTIFCRGVSWTPIDLISLNPEKLTLKTHLQMIKDAGMNMIRIGGTMVYETDEFYKMCDEMGIMVWQDFMLANMDYPFDSVEFKKEVEDEIISFLDRTQLSPCLVTICGGSEVEQQAAMFGAPRSLWRHPFVSHEMPQLTRKYRPDIPFVPSSPSGGDLPFHTHRGIAHYYGVGAYLLPLSDARTCGVLFATECLGLANIPEISSLESFLESGIVPFHHPQWKERVPRDFGATHDFEDVREHYTSVLFKISRDELARIKRADPSYALQLGRLTSGLLMAKVFAEWRRPQSTCKGGLIWFFKDLWAGSGWGIVDSLGHPKSPYYFLKRVLAPRSVVCCDRELNGIEIHIFNDTFTQLDAQLKITIYRDFKEPLMILQHECFVESRSSAMVPLEALIDYFFDSTYTYQFGPKPHTAIHVKLESQGQFIGEDWYFPDLKETLIKYPAEINYEIEQNNDGSSTLLLTSKQIVPWVVVDVPGWVPEDNYFCLGPAHPKCLRLVSSENHSKKIEGFLWLINQPTPIKIRQVKKDAPPNQPS